MADHIFISYSHNDSAFTGQLKNKLEAAQMSCWMDSSLHIGNYWTAEIDKAMREAYAFIVVLSPDSVISQYVNYEVGFASALRLKIIPVQCSPYNPNKALLHLSQLQSLNFMDSRTHAWDKLVTLLRQTRQEHQTVLGQIKHLMQGFSTEGEYEKCKQRLHDLVDYIESHTAAYEELVKAAKHHRSSVRLLVLQLMVEKTRSHDTRALPMLEQILNNHEERSDIRQEAVKVLAKIGKDAISPLINFENDRDPAVAQAVSNALHAIGGETVPYLLQKVDTGEYHEVRVLSRINKIGTAAIPYLRDHMNSENPVIRQTAAKALRGINEKGFSALVEETASSSKTARLIAIQTLGRAGDERAASALVRILNESIDADSRATAAEALGVIALPNVVLPLFRTVFDPDINVAQAAYRAIVYLREIAAPEMSGILLNSRDVDHRKMAASLLREICHESAIPALINAMNDRDERVRRSVAKALACFGSAILSDLLPCLDDHASLRALTAAWALHEIGDAKAAPGLIKALADTRKSPVALRRVAAEALGRMQSLIAIPELKRALNDRDADLQRLAADALKQIGGNDAQSAYDSWKRKRR